MIIFSDIHGQFRTFEALYNSIPSELIKEGVCIAGDLIDRGPNSMQMIQWCIDHSEIDVILGNHEQMLLEDYATALININSTIIAGYATAWMSNGGNTTIESYIIDGVFDEDLFNTHIKWLRTLPLYKEYPVCDKQGNTLLVTHSSAHKVWKWDKRHRIDQRKHFAMHLLWGRSNNIKPIEGVYNIFGHTPIKNGPRITECYANIDTGCTYKDNRGLGILTAIHYPTLTVYQKKQVK